MKNICRLILVGLLELVSLFSIQAAMPEEDTYPTPERLFYIARSLNRNLVCYDVNVQGGKLDLDEPIEVYWLNRMDRPGYTNGLNFIQRKLAYGYKVKQKGNDACRVTLSAYPRDITIRKEGDSYQAFVDINGSPARLVSLFVQLKPNSSINVDYVELQGYAVETGKRVTERIHQ